jgi:hypothetical protein
MFVVENCLKQFWHDSFICHAEKRITFENEQGLKFLSFFALLSLNVVIPSYLQSVSVNSEICVNYTQWHVEVGS